MADTKITLEFEATGADQVVAEVKKVEAAEEELSLQEQRKHRLAAGGISSLATAPPDEAAAAERAAKRAANRLTIEKAVAEAQANRIASAQVAAREQAAADLAAVLAAREKLALEEKNTAAVLKRAVMRAVLPRSRLTSAGRMVANNSAALSMLGNVAKTFVTGPWAILVAAMVAGGVAINKVGQQFDKLKEVMPKAELGAVAETFIHPWETAKNMVGASVNFIGSVLDKVFLDGSYARTKQGVAEAVSSAKNAENAKARYEAMAAAYTQMENAALALLEATGKAESSYMRQALEDAGKLAKAQGGLDASRAKRAGADTGTLAVDAVKRTVDEDRNAEKIAQIAVDDANTHLLNLITEKQKDSAKLNRLLDQQKQYIDSDEKIPEKLLDAITKTRDSVSAKAIQIVEAQEKSDSSASNLATLIKEHDIQLTQSAEEAVDTVATETGGKVTAMVQDAIGVIQKVADDNGGKLTGTAKGAMDKLTAIFQDNIPDEQQVDAINQAMKAFRGSQDAANAGVVTNFDGMLKNMSGMLDEISRHRSEISAMQSAIQQLAIRNR